MKSKCGYLCDTQSDFITIRFVSAHLICLHLEQEKLNCSKPFGQMNITCNKRNSPADFHLSLSICYQYVTSVLANS